MALVVSFSTAVSKVKYALSVSIFEPKWMKRKTQKSPWCLCEIRPKAPEQLLNEPCFVDTSSYWLILRCSLSGLHASIVLSISILVQVDFFSLRQSSVICISPHIIIIAAERERERLKQKREKKKEHVFAAIATDQRHIRSYWNRVEQPPRHNFKGSRFWKRK